jgi:hypothetical protein
VTPYDPSNPLSFDTTPEGMEVSEGGMVNIAWLLAGGPPILDEWTIRQWEKTQPMELA